MASVVGDALVEPRPAGLTRSGAARLDAIDLWRGLVIVLMVLDHVRDFFFIASWPYDPTDAVHTTPALFATRWVTHLCATSFVFMAGVSILFQKANGKPPAALSAFLVKRGLWLILLEVTVVSFGFNFAEPFVFLQVIWAIGVSMITMAALSRLPSRAVLAIGVAILALYPLAVTASAGATGAAAIVRMFALAPGVIPGTPILAMYAAVPWLGVMCLGFGLGPHFRLERTERNRRVLLLAGGMLALFVVLRALDGYGDPRPWSQVASGGRAVMAFLDVSKYPPSPDYVLATLGVGLLLFLLLEHLRGPAAALLLAFGRTPLFTYLVHIYLAHGLMLLVMVLSGFPWTGATGVISGAVAGHSPTPPEWGFGLPVVYLVWATVVALLYPLARWFAGVKRRRRDGWLSYL